MKTYFVYILCNASGTLYVGMTSDLEKRMYQHKGKILGGFTAKYNINKLLYIEEFTDVYDAMARERQLKGWSRRMKIALFDELNPGWHDLSAGWFDATPVGSGDSDPITMVDHSGCQIYNSDFLVNDHLREGEGQNGATSLGGQGR